MVTKYYIDEAGDSVLFDRHGNIIIGNEGISKFFILGLLEIGDPFSLGRNLEHLRDEVLSDPYFSGVPSLDPDRKKTAISFHAKDDLSEIRYKVYELLKQRDDIRFFAVVGDKLSTLDYVQSRQRQDMNYRYHPNEMYDFLTRRLFRDRLHLDDEYQVVIAQRGSKKRNQALRKQLEVAQEKWLADTKRNHRPIIQVQSGLSKHYAGLQAVDYYLWALQRCFEREEDRFIKSIWHQCSLIVDMDDRRNNGYGEYYNKKNPLTVQKIVGRRRSL